MSVKEETIIAARLLWYSCDKPDCDEKDCIVNPSPMERMRGPKDWTRAKDGTLKCPACSTGRLGE